MRPKRKSSRRERSGSILIIAMMFVVVFSALAVCMTTLSGNSVQLASNHHQLGCALASAESGLQVMRYWLTRVTIPNSTAQEDYFAAIVNSFANDLAANGISNITVEANGFIPAVTLQTADGQSFTAQIEIQADQPNILEVYATGGNDRITHTIKVCYEIEPDRHPVFDYGIATKGPLHLQGSCEVDGLNHNSEADVYIECEGIVDALSMTGNTAIAGDVRIGNPDAEASVGNPSSIGGETGQDAIDNHVTTAAPPFDFPELDIVRFEDYVENDLDPETDTSNDMTLENIRILPNTNPHFSGNVSLRGIVFVESPNIVKFTGNTDIIGMIIGDGDLDFPDADNQLIFLGNVSSQSVSELGAGFGDLREETGTFLMAPGFSVSFGGSFETLNGVIAASAIDFSGNAGGIINGTVMNYGDDPMAFTGSVDLVFDHSAIQIPAGFESEIVLQYDPCSYSVVEP